MCLLTIGNDKDNPGSLFSLPDYDNDDVAIITAFIIAVHYMLQ